MDKRKVFGTILGSIGFIVFILAITYAFYVWRSEETDVSINLSDSYFYCESGQTKTIELMALTNYYSGGENTYVDFAVNNVGGTDSNFSISMNISSASSELFSEQVLYQVVVDTTGGTVDCATGNCTPVSSGNFKDFKLGMNTLAESVTIANDSRNKYYVFLYLGNGNNAGLAGKELTFTLDVCEIVAFLDYNGGNITEEFVKITGDTYGETSPTIPATPTKSSTTINYNSNGGSSVNASTINYTFGGWYKDEGTWNSKIESTTPINTTLNHTLYAKWNVSSITTPTTPPTRTGYTFKGWKDENGTLYNAGSSYTLPYDTEKTSITLTAQWEANKYTITLNGNGATKAGTSSVTATYDSSTIDPSTITLPEKKYTVSGFTTSDSRNSTGATITSTTSLPSTYKFNGWYTTSTGGSKVLNETTTPTFSAGVSGYTNADKEWIRASNTTLYAKWTDENVAVTLPEITKTGYTCGWTNEENGTTIKYESEGSFTPTADTPMYAVCVPEKYTVTFDVNDGTAWTSSTCTGTGMNFSSSTCSKTVNYNSTYGTLPTPTRTGYSFDGWYTAASGGSEIKSSTTVGILANQTLYAHWAPIQYDITLEAGEGVNSLTFSGWTDSGSKKLTKKLNYNDTISLSSISIDLIPGYENTTMTLKSGAGTLNNNTFTVGMGNATLTISATLSANANYLVKSENDVIKGYYTYLNDAIVAADKTTYNEIELLKNFYDTETATFNKSLSFTVNDKTLIRNKAITIANGARVNVSGTTGEIIGKGDAAVFYTYGELNISNLNVIVNPSGSTNRAAIKLAIDSDNNAVLPGTLNVSSSKILSTNYFAINNSSYGDITINNSQLGGSYSYIDYSNNNQTVNVSGDAGVRNAGVGDVNISSTNIYATGTDTAYAALSNVDDGKIEYVSGTIEANHIGIWNQSTGIIKLGSTSTNSSNGPQVSCNNCVTVNNSGAGFIEILSGTYSGDVNVIKNTADYGQVSIGQEFDSTKLDNPDTTKADIFDNSYVVKIIGEGTGADATIFNAKSGSKSYLNIKSHVYVYAEKSNAISNAGGDVRINFASKIENNCPNTHTYAAIVNSQYDYSSQSNRDNPFEDGDTFTYYWARILLKGGQVVGNVHGIKSYVSSNYAVYVGYAPPGVDADTSGFVNDLSNTQYWSYPDLDTNLDGTIDVSDIEKSKKLLIGPYVHGKEKRGIVIENSDYKYRLSAGMVSTDLEGYKPSNVKPTTTKDNVEVTYKKFDNSDPYSYYFLGLSVTLNVNGGNAWTDSTCTGGDFSLDDSVCSKPITNGLPYGTLLTPTRDGYKFDGWYTAASGGTKITSDTIVSASASQTLYAHWIANKATINLKENGADASTTGYSVSLSTSSSSDTATFTGTTTGSSISFEKVVSGTKYYVWAGKSSNAKTSRLYSGKYFTASADTTQSETIAYFGLTLTKGTGISAVSNGGTSTTNEVQYLYNEENPQAILIDATVNSGLGYIWNNWQRTSGRPPAKFTAGEKSQSIIMSAGDVTLNASTINPPPTVSDIVGGTTLKATSQNLTLKCTDTIGVTAYYWGTTEPTSASDITTTTAADLTSLQGSSGLTKTVTSEGKYWLACKDASGSYAKKNIVIRKYQVQNVLEEIAGTTGTYTSTNYVTAGTAATYYVKEGTSLTLASIYTAPTAGNKSGKFQGYTTEAPRSSAVSPNTTAPTAPSNDTTVYYMWFNRNTYTVTVTKHENGKTVAQTETQGSNSVTVNAGASSNGSLTVKYDDTVKATATASTGYSFTEWSGGYLSGSTNPSTGGKVTEDKTITASFTATPYTITVNSGTGGSVKVEDTTKSTSVTAASGETKTITVNYGDTIKVTATASTGYNLSTLKHGSTSMSSGGTFTASGAETVAATWSTISYKITYDENGGSDVSDTTYNIASAITLAAAPTKAGYTFNGWKLASNTSNWSAGTYNASQSIAKGKYGNITLVAQWTANPYNVTITIKKDGSAWSSSGMNVALYSGSTLKYAYSTATVSGSTVTFSGVSDGTYNVYATISGDSATTLANTGKTVSASSNTATIDYYTFIRVQNPGTTLTTRYNSTSETTGTVFTDETKVLLSGINIWGKATANTGYNTPILAKTYGSITGNPIENPSYVTMDGSNLKLISAAEPNTYTVSFDDVGNDNLVSGMEDATGSNGSGGTYEITDGEVTVIHGNTYPNQAFTLLPINAYLEGNNNYTISFKLLAFDESFGAPILSFESDDYEIIAPNFSSCTNYDEICTVNFHVDGASRQYYLGITTRPNGVVAFKDLSITKTTTTSTIPPITVTYDSTYGTLPTPARSGYIFNGWYTSSSGGTKVTSSTTVSTASNHTLYASWNPVQYTVTLTKGTGIASVTGAGTYNAGDTVTINATLSDNYIWSNWTGSSTQTSKSYTFTINSNVSFTANAQAAVYNIKNGSGTTTGCALYLEDAINQASAGYTITLLKTNTEGTKASVNKNVTFNTNGYNLFKQQITVNSGVTLTKTGTGTITGTSGATFAVYGTLNIQNGSITNTTTIGGGTGRHEETGVDYVVGFNTILNNSTGTVNISGGTLTNSGDNYSTGAYEEYVIYNNGGTVNITGGTISGHAGVLNTSNGNVTLNGGTININQITAANNTYTSCAIASNDAYASNINIISGTITTDAYVAGNYNENTGTVTISGGSITATSSRNQSMLHNNSSDSNYKGTINITGGTIINNGTGAGDIINNNRGYVNISGSPQIIANSATQGHVIGNNNGGEVTISSGTLTNNGSGRLLSSSGASTNNITGGTLTSVGTNIYIDGTGFLNVWESTATITATGQSTAIHCGNASSGSKAICYFKGKAANNKLTITALNTTAGNGILNYGGDLRVYTNTVIKARNGGIVNKGTYSSENSQYYARAFVRGGYVQGGDVGLHNEVDSTYAVYVGYGSDDFYNTYGPALTNSAPIIQGDTNYGIYSTKTGFKYRLNNGLVLGANSASNLSARTTRDGYTPDTKPINYSKALTLGGTQIDYNAHYLKASS